MNEPSNQKQSLYGGQQMLEMQPPPADQQEEVKALLGPPTAVHDYTFFVVWNYGEDRITFRDGKVSEYENQSGRLPID